MEWDKSGEGRADVLMAGDMTLPSSVDRMMEGEVDLRSKGRSSGSWRVNLGCGGLDSNTSPDVSMSTEVV